MIFNFGISDAITISQYDKGNTYNATTKRFRIVLLSKKPIGNTSIRLGQSKLPIYVFGHWTTVNP